MKRRVILWGFVFPFLLITACGNKQNPRGLAVSPIEETPSKEDSENTGSLGIPIRIYHSDDSGEGLRVSVTRTEEVTPEILLLNLSFYQMIPDMVSIRSFEQKKQEDGVMLTLDLSGDFEEYLSGLDTFGETMAMGSLVNTFLDAYEGSSILITVEGETLNTGRGSYEETLELYPYAEASYQVETKELSRDGIQISYPQLAGLSDELIQEKWNKVIGEHAKRAFTEAEEGSSLEVAYTIKTMNDQRLSILMEGYYNQKDAPYPVRFCYAYNIDMLSGESIRLVYRRDTDELAAELLSGMGYTVEGEPAEEFRERLAILYGDQEQLADTLRSFDYGENRETPAGFSYEEEGRLHLCIEVPHALGDYVDAILE